MPMNTQPVVSMVSDPPTDKKPPVGPASVRPSPSLERTATRPAVQPQPAQPKTVQPEPEKVPITPAPADLSNSVTEMASTCPDERNKEDLVGVQTPSTTGMKSRLQRLAEQRKCWDGDYY